MHMTRPLLNFPSIIEEDAFLFPLEALPLLLKQHQVIFSNGLLLDLPKPVSKYLPLGERKKKAMTKWNF